MTTHRMRMESVEATGRAGLLAELAAILPAATMRDVVPGCSDEQLRHTLTAALAQRARYAALGVEDMAADKG